MASKYHNKRASNDAVMVADVGFKKQLWALDPRLDVVWNFQKCKWEIWSFPGQEKKVKKVFDDRAILIMTVQTQGRTFRELGADIFLNLQAGDTTKYSLKQLVAYFDQMDDNIQRAKERELRARIKDIALETFDYTRGVLKLQVPREYKFQRVITGA